MPEIDNRGAPGQGQETAKQVFRPDEQKPAEWPRYKLTEKSYINDMMLQPGEEIVLDPKAIPGRSMEPINDAAKAQWMAHKERLTRDPLAHLMIAPSAYEIQPHQLAVLDNLAGSMGLHPLGKNHPAYGANKSSGREDRASK